ncbi:MAG: ATP-binding protein [Solirubrobacteraceae bacterium]|nr:ATP-binding protein [Patulibacter sp.]
MSAPVTLDELRTIDLFDDLSEAELAEWQAIALPYEVGPGELIAEEGTAYQGVQLLLTGTARAMQIRGDALVPGPRQRSPTWMGAVSTLTGGKAAVRMLAETDCRVASVNADDFKRLAASQPIVTERVMQIVAPVMSRMAAIEQSREHLASLGTMAAGLAHELNNPAAAAERAASQLIEALETVNTALRKFVSAGIERDQAAELLALQEEAIDRAAKQTALSALDAADAEDEFLDALEEHGVPEAWKIAEPLASAGLDRSWLERVIASTPHEKAITIVLRWVAATLTARGLADELQESTRRMTGLVGAVKSYAYMDRGEVMEIDLHEGLETTVVVLGHKLKVTSIEVVRDYDRALPRMMARGPELNQVWTNLIDNAIDALAGQDDGRITIKTSRDADCALIQFTDNGPGIPPEVASRVFETFFTTKEVGKGTGLGLATAYRIVVDGHDGSLTVDSEPGRTTFNVWLPYPAATTTTDTPTDLD